MMQFSEYTRPARSACWRACERAAPGGALACEASGKLPSGPGGWWAAFNFELVLALSFMYSHHIMQFVQKACCLFVRDVCPLTASLRGPLFVRVWSWTGLCALR